jgi:hypothetical protein
MPHDKRGTELQVGDTVMVPCRVKAIHLTEDYCNVDLETKIPMPPLCSVQALTLNSQQTIKPTATYRFNEYEKSTPLAEPTASPQSVYIVEQGLYSDRGIVGVYATPEAAMTEHPLPKKILKHTEREGGWQPLTDAESGQEWHNGLIWDDCKTIKRYTVEGTPHPKE